MKQTTLAPHAFKRGAESLSNGTLVEFVKCSFLVDLPRKVAGTVGDSVKISHVNYSTDIMVKACLSCPHINDRNQKTKQENNNPLPSGFQNIRN